MVRTLLQTLGIAAVASAALLLAPATSLAQHHGGSSGGGGRGGGGAHYSGGSGHYQGGSGHYYGGSPYSGGGRGYYDHRDGFRGGYGYYPGYNYPRYYDRSYYGSNYSTPDYYAEPGYSVAPDYEGAPAGVASEQDSARVTANFRMPAADAELFVEGQRMEGSGRTRQFVSPPLDSDGRYTYQFEARWNDNGRERKETRTARVHAGDRITVDFSRPADNEGRNANPRAGEEESQP